MRTRLGVAGVPADLGEIVTLGEELGVSLLLLLDGPCPDFIPKDIPVLSLDFSVEAHEAIQALESASLAGVWVADPRYREPVEALAARFGWPHLPGDEAENLSLVPNAQTFNVAMLQQIATQSSDSLPIPSWVRTPCADGDTSCMRVEHPSDLSLALNKLKKRRADGRLRIQPAVEGTIYRLLAFKTGTELLPFDVVEETVTTSVYRVPLAMAMPVARNARRYEAMIAESGRVNDALAPGWGYVEMEFVCHDDEVVLTDVQAPAAFGADLRAVIFESQGVDLYRAAMECALGRAPTLRPRRDQGAALTWLLTRSGVVTGFEGVDSARQLPGVRTVHIAAKEGDILSHVVDRPSRERGGYILATGDTATEAWEHLEAARVQVWINTSPALS